MRFGIVVLPDLAWSEARERWQAAEAMGFDHGWTYDHLVWAGMVGAPWAGSTPLLAAAAAVTSRIRVGTFVASPNYRHPAVLYRDVQALETVSDGRMLLGVGVGGDLDSQLLGEALTVGGRVSRFEEFTRLLLRLRTEEVVSHQGRWFSLSGFPTATRPVRTPLLVAANGPRSLRFAAQYGDGWVTTGPAATDLPDWFAAHERAHRIIDETLAEAGRDPSAFRRYVSLDQAPRYSLADRGTFELLVTRAAALGFTDVVVHWPRPEAPYAGSRATLESIASTLMPALRGHLRD